MAGVFDFFFDFFFFFFFAAAAEVAEAVGVPSL